MIALKKKVVVFQNIGTVKTIREELSNFIADFSLWTLGEQGFASQ